MRTLIVVLGFVAAISITFDAGNAQQSKPAKPTDAQLRKPDRQDVGVQLPRGCTFQLITSNRLKFFCQDRSTGYLIMTATGHGYLRFLSRGQYLQVISIDQLASGKVAGRVLEVKHVAPKLIERNEEQKLRRCLHAAEWCSLNQYVYQHPNEDAWPPWVELWLALPMCQGEPAGDCDKGPSSFDLCRILSGGCKDPILPSIGHGDTQGFFCAAHTFCDR